MTRLACPNCGDTDLDTLEVATCVAECDEITTDGPQYSGTTDYERGEQDTTGVICNSCQWEYEGDDWLTKLIPEGDVALIRQRRIERTLA